MREKIAIGLAVAAAALLSYNLYQMFMVLPDEAMQGAIYRILFFHAPSAIVGMIGYFIALTFSVLYLSSGKLRWDSLSASVIEVALVFSVVNINTGSIWARIIWGIWWTWDYRLTSALVCVLIFAGYLMMRRAIEEPTQRARLSSALCIFGCVDVVIVWRHHGSGNGAYILAQLSGDPDDRDRARAGPNPPGSDGERDRLPAPVRKRYLVKKEIKWTPAISLTCSTAFWPRGLLCCSTS
jgi:hypothetical protein